MRPFLTARWEDLALVTYRVDADLVRGLLPAGLEPDTLPDDGDGVAYVSLVAFLFLDTKVRGLAVPGHRDFPEVNLRTYVRTVGEVSPRRGVVFIRELVPLRLVTLIANALYAEHYKTVPICTAAEDRADGRRRHHTRIEHDGRTSEIVLAGDREPAGCDPGSREQFFKEHSWGFGTDRGGRLSCYRVDHPVWRVYPVRGEADLTLRFDFAGLYGQRWGVLADASPFHVAYAVGSPVAVFPRQ